MNNKELILSGPNISKLKRHFEDYTISKYHFKSSMMFEIVTIGLLKNDKENKKCELEIKYNDYTEDNKLYRLKVVIFECEYDDFVNITSYKVIKERKCFDSDLEKYDSYIMFV